MPEPERMTPALGGWQEVPRPGPAPESRVRDWQGRGEVLQQIDALRRRMNRLETGWGGSDGRDRLRAERPEEESHQQQTPPEQAERPLTRVERNKPSRLAGLTADVNALQTQVDAIQQELVQTHALVDSMLSQCGRSTVGSAGYCWGW
jgi:hypothetical protein